MAIPVGTTNSFGARQLYVGIPGVNDNDIVLETDDVTRFITFFLMSTAGAMDVLVSLDGTNFITAPLSLADLGATSTAPVIVTAAGRMYGFDDGAFQVIRILQNGATAVANALMMAAMRR